MDGRVKFATLMLLLLGSSSFFVEGYSQYGDILVYDDNGTIHCDKIICPPNTFQCKVTKDTDPRNRSIIVRMNRCLDKDGKELTSKLTEEPNPNPGNEIHLQISEAGGSSFITTGLNAINNVVINDVKDLPPGFPFHNGNFPKIPHFPPGFPFHNGGFPKMPTFPPGFPFHNGGAPKFPKFPAGFPFYDDGDGNDSDHDNDNDD